MFKKITKAFSISPRGQSVVQVVTLGSLIGAGSAALFMLGVCAIDAAFKRE